MNFKLLQPGNHTFALAAGEELNLAVVELDEADEKCAVEVLLEGEGARVVVRGVALVSGGKSVQNAVKVVHQAKNCESDVLFKSAVAGAGSEYSWVGDVVIKSTATRTKTYEENRNMLLTKGARAHSEPNLEIETGDILSAGHASATGRFDDEQLFYLQSRGLDETTAKRLVVEGFLESVVAEIDPEGELKLVEKLNSRLNALNKPEVKNG